MVDIDHDGVVPVGPGRRPTRSDDIVEAGFTGDHPLGFRRAREPGPQQHARSGGLEGGDRVTEHLHRGQVRSPLK